MSPLGYADISRITLDYSLRTPAAAAELIFAAGMADTDSLRTLKIECEKRGLDMDLVGKELCKLIQRDFNLLADLRNDGVK